MDTYSRQTIAVTFVEKAFQGILGLRNICLYSHQLSIYNRQSSIFNLLTAQGLDNGASIGHQHLDIAIPFTTRCANGVRVEFLWR